MSGPRRLGFVRHDGMQHFVIQNVLEKPERDEFLIQPRIDANDAVFFLDSAENKIFLRTFPTFAAPDYLVPTQAIAKVTRVDFVEDMAQIEISAVGFQAELPLQWQPRSCDFSFCPFGHIPFKSPDWSCGTP